MLLLAGASFFHLDGVEPFSPVGLVREIKTQHPNCWSSQKKWRKNFLAGKWRGREKILTGILTKQQPPHTHSYHIHFMLASLSWFVLDSKMWNEKLNFRPHSTSHSPTYSLILKPMRHVTRWFLFLFSLLHFFFILASHCVTLWHKSLTRWSNKGVKVDKLKLFYGWESMNMNRSDYQSGAKVWFSWIEEDSDCFDFNMPSHFPQYVAASTFYSFFIYSCDKVDAHSLLSASPQYMIYARIHSHSLSYSESHQSEEGLYQSHNSQFRNTELEKKFFEGKKSRWKHEASRHRLSKHNRENLAVNRTQTN